MWGDIKYVTMKPFSKITFIVKAIYLGHWYHFFLTEVCWKSNNIFSLLRITKLSEQEQYIYIVYDKSIWYTAGSLSWATNATYPTVNQLTNAK